MFPTPVALQNGCGIEFGEILGRQHVSGVLVQARNAVAQTGEDLVADGACGTTPIVSGRLGIILATAGVLLTAAFVAAFAVGVLGFTWLQGLLLGSVISSTDAAIEAVASFC